MLGKIHRGLSELKIKKQVKQIVPTIKIEHITMTDPKLSPKRGYAYYD